MLFDHSGSGRVRQLPGVALALLFLILFILAGPSAAFAEQNGIELEPTAEAAALTGEAEPLSAEVFARHALLLSGAGPEAVESGMERLGRWAEQMLLELKGIEAPREKAERILAFMHERILSRYDVRQTRLDTLIQDGRFNCVSSAVLYSFLGKSAGLRVWGIRTPDHAFSRILAGGQAFDVETTSPYGFNPGVKKEFTDHFGKVTGFTYVPPTESRSRQELEDRALLALILFNRSAFLSEDRSFAAALGPALDADTVLASPESRERLLVSLMNLASWHGMSRRYPEGLQVLEKARSRYGPEPRLIKLERDLLYNWILDRIAVPDIEAAQELLEDGFSGTRLDEKDWKRLYVHIVQVRAREASSRDWEAAARLVAEGMERAGRVPELLRSYEVIVHNHLVELINAARLDEAGRILASALDFYPESPLLKKDRESLENRR